MAKQYQKVSGAKETIRFLIKRFRKFYLNYWVIFLIFVPIGIFVFHRSLHAVYGEDANILQCTLIDIMGMQGFQSYNITWWFNQLIILLYLLFPFMYLYARWKPWLALLTSIAILPFMVNIPYIPAEICIWQLSFMAGICWQLYEDKMPKLSVWITEHNALFSLISGGSVVLLILLRILPGSPLYAATSMDAFLSVSIALSMTGLFRHLPRTSVFLAFLGKHSANIYLIHTFFNRYWFPHLLHDSAWMRWGCNFLILITLCLSISILLEYLKQKISALFS